MINKVLPAPKKKPLNFQNKIILKNINYKGWRKEK